MVRNRSEKIPKLNNETIWKYIHKNIKSFAADYKFERLIIPYIVGIPETHMKGEKFMKQNENNPIFHFSITLFALGGGISHLLRK